MATATAALHRIRGSSLIDAIGLLLLAVVVIWLVVKFFEDPTRFVNVGIIGATNGAIYGLIALGYTLVYGILQLINFAHGDVFALSGLVASTMIISVFGLDERHSRAHDHRWPARDARGNHSALRCLQRHDRAHRVQAAPKCAQACAADHCGRDVVHRLEHLARDLWSRLRVGSELHPADGRDHHRGYHHSVEQDRRVPDRDSGPSSCSRGSCAPRVRGRRCAPSLRTRKRQP